MADTFMRYGSSCEFPFSGYDFHLLLRTFIMSIRMAELEEKVKNLTQKIAIQNHETGNEIENLKVKVGNNEND